MSTVEPDWLPAAKALWPLERDDPDRAEAAYRDLLDRYPAEVDLRTMYASFLAHVRGDVDGAEAMFQQLMAQPTALLCSTYAWFRYTHRGDADGAERLLRQAAELAEPDRRLHATMQRMLAHFLWDVRGDAAAAAPLFRASLEPAEGDPWLLLDAGRFFCATGETAEGLALVEAALAAAAAAPEESSPVRLLCWFCLFAHGDAARAETAWTEARRLAEAGVIWGEADQTNLAANVAAARSAGHPRPDRVEALAAVVLGQALPAKLAGL